jgi:peptidoglycan-N-acetylglucosamine deacetylase
MKIITPQKERLMNFSKQGRIVLAGIIFFVLLIPVPVIGGPKNAPDGNVVYCLKEKARNFVYLTFDDGPTPDITLDILSTLKKYDAKATFFLVGRNVRRYPGIAKNIIDSGNEVANHTYSHLNLRYLTSKSIISQIMLTQHEIFHATGIRTGIMRPPFSSFDSNVSCHIKRCGLKIILWTVSPADYENPSPEEIARRVLDRVKPGDIIVLHDGCENTESKRINTAKALPLILEGLKQKKLKPVGLSKFLKNE